MNIKTRLKILWSYFTEKPIQIGFGVTTDDSINLPRDSGIDVANGNSVHRGTFFKQKTIHGDFELVGFTKSGDKVLYQLKHIYSGETFNLTRNMLDFLFEKSN